MFHEKFCLFLRNMPNCRWSDIQQKFARHAPLKQRKKQMELQLKGQLYLTNEMVINYKLTQECSKMKDLIKEI